MRSWVQVATKFTKVNTSVKYQRQNFENGLAAFPENEYQFDREQVDDQREDFVNVMLSLSVEEARIVGNVLFFYPRGTGALGNAGASGPALTRLAEEVKKVLAKAEEKQAELDNPGVYEVIDRWMKKTQSYKDAETR